MIQSHESMTLRFPSYFYRSVVRFAGEDTRISAACDTIPVWGLSPQRGGTDRRLRQKMAGTIRSRPV